MDRATSAEGKRWRFSFDMLGDPGIPEDTIVADPVVRLQATGAIPNPRLPPPAALYPDRRNSKGLDLADRAFAPAVVQGLRVERAPRDLSGAGVVRAIRDPSDRRRLIGTAPDATEAEIDSALRALTAGWRAWDAFGGNGRADVLERAAELIEGVREELLFLLAREAGRTLTDGIAEVREAADFCRWYAVQARTQFGTPRELPGPTGERNVWSLHGRGVFACISPWNFPLSIFLGQLTAALAAGNAVAAKPAEQTPLIATRATELLHEAGVPKNVLRCLLGNGVVGAALTQDARIAGVAFTGGTDTAQAIARALADRPGPIVPLIAETGGINAMIVDSSALPEQVVGDVLTSAFGSAGQRCSSLRLLCLQEDIADKVLGMLRGAAEMLVIGDPLDPATDIGPIIDADAHAALTAYAQEMGSPLFQLALPAGTERGTFFAPRAFAISGPSAVSREIFGPILHVARFSADRLDELLDEISSNGFGLTLSVHSRIEATQRHIAERLRVGNVYVNRNQIGAVVGVQPFGGRGLSGTGPKAGGPITLFRYAEEYALSVNTAAVGGNATLLATEEDSAD